MEHIEENRKLYLHKIIRIQWLILLLCILGFITSIVLYPRASNLRFSNFLLVLQNFSFFLGILIFYILLFLSDCIIQMTRSLEVLHWLSILISIGFFIRWGIFQIHALAFLFPTYVGLFTLVNLLGIKGLRKYGGCQKLIGHEWKSLLTLMTFYVFYFVIYKILN